MAGRGVGTFCHDGNVLCLDLVVVVRVVVVG